MSPAEQLPVLNAYLDDGDKVVVLVEQLPDGRRRRRRVPAEYVSYHRREDVVTDLLRELKSAESVAGVGYEGERWIRVAWGDRWLRERGLKYLRTRHDVAAYEGDVDPIRYHLTRTKSQIARPRTCYLDIESDSRVPFSRKEDMRILCWAVICADTGDVRKGVLEAETDADEGRLLAELWEALAPFDQVAAWNGDGFDFPLIESRSKKQHLVVDPRRWLWLDQLVAWRRMNQHSAESGAEKESFRLEDIAQAQIGEGKEAAPQFVIDRFGAVPPGSIAWDLWEAGGAFRQLLVDYNVKDTILLRKLEKKKGYLFLFQSVCEATRVFGNTRGLNPTRQMDGFLLLLGRDLDYRFDTKRYADDDEVKKFRGAWVMTPKTTGGGDDWSVDEARAWRLARGMTTGILRDVHVCDFASLYPSVILTWNLSEDTVVGRENAAGAATARGYCYSPGTGLVTRTDRHGILTIALRELLRLRKYYSDLAATLPPGTPEWQDAMARSTAYKVIANSFYGVAGSPTSRFFRQIVAESTTQNSVWLLKLVFAEALKRGMEGVYGDTDSAFVVGPTREGFEAFVNWLNKKHFPKMIAEQGCAENHVKLAFEKTFSRLVFTSAKRYVGRYSHYKGTAARADSKPEVKGLEYKRGDTALLARKLQGRVIDLLVGGMTWKDAAGAEHLCNPGVEVPTEDLAVYHGVLSEARDHVLMGELAREEVRLSKALNGTARSYDKKKCPGCKGSIPASARECPKCSRPFAKAESQETLSDLPHVAVAKIMEQRGQEVGDRTRVEYVVVDGAVSPMRVIPAEDFAGECDRYYLWENLVFPPTLRLLEAAFPEHDWTSWHKVRPKKARAAGKALAGQLGLFADASSPRGDDPSRGAASRQFTLRTLAVDVPEVAGREAVDRVLLAIARNPGARPVEIVIHSENGGRSVLPVIQRVTTGQKLADDLADALGEMQLSHV